MKRGRTASLTAVLVAVLVGLATAVIVTTSEGTKKVTAYFSQAVNIHPGDKVRVMGVQVGKITAVRPDDAGVRVDMTYQEDAPVPADAKAVVIAPTLVSSRYVQLTPARSKGRRLPDDAVIDNSRTAVPVEWDQVKKQLDELTTALGPDETGKKGRLNRLVETTAANLGGQGETLRSTIESLSRAAGTVSAGRGDIFGTVRNLETLIDALAKADRYAGEFNTRLSDVAHVLAENKDQFARMLTTLDSSVQRIDHFVRTHRSQLAGNVTGLAKVARNLAANRQALADALQKAPAGLSNFANIYDPFSGSITGALAPTNFRDPANFLCGALFSLGGTPEQCKQAIGPLGELLKMDTVPVQADPVQRNGASNVQDAHDAPPPDPSPTMAPPPAERPRGSNSGLAELLAPGGTS